MLEESQEEHVQTTIIAKARRIYHCERCNIDHNRRKRIFISTLIAKLQKRMTPIYEIQQKQEERKKKRDGRKKKNKHQITKPEGQTTNTSSTAVFFAKTIAKTHSWFLTTLPVKSWSQTKQTKQRNLKTMSNHKETLDTDMFLMALF